MQITLNNHIPSVVVKTITISRFGLSKFGYGGYLDYLLILSKIASDPWIFALIARRFYYFGIGIVSRHLHRNGHERAALAIASKFGQLSHQNSANCRIKNQPTVALFFAEFLDFQPKMD